MPKNPPGEPGCDDMRPNTNDDLFERELLNYYDENLGSSTQSASWIRSNDIFSPAKSIAAWNAKWKKPDPHGDSRNFESGKFAGFSQVKLPERTVTDKIPEIPEDLLGKKPHRVKITLESIIKRKSKSLK